MVALTAAGKVGARTTNCKPWTRVVALIPQVYYDCWRALRTLKGPTPDWISLPALHKWDRGIQFGVIEPKCFEVSRIVVNDVEHQEVEVASSTVT